MHAIHKNAPISPKKVRILARFLKGRNAVKAVDELSLMRTKSALLVRKVIVSLLASAENNYNMDVDSLKISSISVDKGRVLRRIMPRAKGRAFGIKKRSSHIKIIVDSGK